MDFKVVANKLHSGMIDSFTWATGNGNVRKKGSLETEAGYNDMIEMIEKAGVGDVELVIVESEVYFGYCFSLHF